MGRESRDCFFPRHGHRRRRQCGDEPTAGFDDVVLRLAKGCIGQAGEKVFPERAIRKARRLRLAPAFGQRDHGLEHARQEARGGADDLHPQGQIPFLSREEPFRANLPTVEVQVPHLRRRPLRGVPLRLYDAPRVGHPEGRVQVCRRHDVVLPAAEAFCGPRARARRPLGLGGSDPLVQNARRRVPRHCEECRTALDQIPRPRGLARLHPTRDEQDRAAL
mmetsp:Transcript_32768/g.110399  ORF Transcript_32768/g.110399 Transcript_32768/m.110399 type:complete len:220 (-) Transcript_32768:376-1035(-)